MQPHFVVRFQGTSYPIVRLLDPTNLLAPGEQYGDRLNQLDFRFAKILRYGHTRTMIGLDLYNSLNSSAILTYNGAFVAGGTWNQPVTVLTARLAKISAELTF